MCVCIHAHEQRVCTCTCVRVRVRRCARRCARVSVRVCHCVSVRRCVRVSIHLRLSSSVTHTVEYFVQNTYAPATLLRRCTPTRAPAVLAIHLDSLSNVNAPHSLTRSPSIPMSSRRAPSKGRRRRRRRPAHFVHWRNNVMHDRYDRRCLYDGCNRNSHGRSPS